MNNANNDNNIENNNNDNGNQENYNNKEIKDENKQEEAKADSPVYNELEKKLKIFVHNIKKEGSSPINYISNLKESININNNSIDVININKLKEFLKSKKIELSDDEAKLLQKQFEIKEENDGELINYDMFEQKLLKIIQNDSDNDEKFLENIPVMEIGGME